MKTIALSLTILAALAAGLAAQDAPSFEGRTTMEWSAAISKATDARARKALVEKLGRPGAKAAPVLIALLAAPDPEVKKFAADTLVVAGWTAIPALEAKGEKSRAEAILRQPFVRYSQHFPEDRTYKCGPEPRFDPARTSFTCEFWTGRRFEMYRFFWKDGKLAADRISYYSPWRNKPKQKVKMASTTMDAARASAMLRALMTATRVAIDTEPDPGEPRIGGTSLHFHGRMFIREGETGVFGSHYTHRLGNRFPIQFLQMLLLEGIVRDAVTGLEWNERKPAESDLAWLEQRTRANSTEDHIVCGNLARFVSAFGDKRFVAWLERVIVETEKARQTQLACAINAYARITGIDYRPKEFTWKQAHEVRRKYLEHFKKAASDT